MTILSVKLFLKEAWIVEFEGMWPLTKCLGNGHRNSFKVHAQALLTCPLFNFDIKIFDVNFLALDVAFQISEMILQIINVHIDREESVGRDDCFNF